MNKLHKSCRLVDLERLARNDLLDHRMVADTSRRPVEQLHVGALMLDRLGLSEGWFGRDLPALPPYNSQVLLIRSPTIVSQPGIVALKSGLVLEDTLDHTSPERDGYERIEPGMATGLDGAARPEGGHVLLPEPAITLQGRHLSLLLGSYGNAYHWILMNVARIGLLRPEELRGLSGILIPASLADAQLALVERTGLSRYGSLVRVESAQAVEVQELLLPWNVASGYGVNPIAVQYLRSLRRVPRGTGSSSEKIYVSRQKALARPLLNEPELINELAKIGFVSVTLEDMMLQEQHEVFANARVIVGCHGAGLVNMVFSDPGARVIELFASDQLNWTYRHVASACRHRYDCVFGRSLPGRAVGPAQAPWMVAPTHVLSALS